MHDTCPKCGSSLKCIGGESAHPDNWYCIQEQRCGWKAWDPVMRGTTDHTIAKLESEVIRLGTKSTRIKSLEAKVKELTAALKQIADNDYIIGWKGAAYIAKTALKQKGE